MCGCSGLGQTTPSGSAPAVPGSPPSGTTGGTALCCTCPANGTVSQNGKGTYFTTTGYSISNLTNKCTIDLARTGSGGTVTITKTFSLAYINGATSASNASTVTSAITAAMGNWSAGASSYKVHIEQPGCAPQDLRIVFASSIVASGADVAVTVDGTSTGPSHVVGGTRMSFKLTGGASRAWTMTHEIGHTFGLPDEYCHIAGIPIVPAPTTAGAATISPPTASPTTTYKGAPPQADVVITQTANRPSTRHIGDYIFDNPSVMGQSGNMTYPANMYYWIAIEVKKIMAAAGASSNVTIV